MKTVPSWFGWSIIGLYCIGLGGAWVNPMLVLLVIPALVMTVYFIIVNHLLVGLEGTRRNWFFVGYMVFAILVAMGVLCAVSKNSCSDGSCQKPSTEIPK